MISYNSIIENTVLTPLYDSIRGRRTDRAQDLVSK